MKRIIQNLLLSVGVLLLIVVVDRVLLASLGRPIWKTDPVLVYRYRPNTSARWGKDFVNKPIRINRYSLHDSDFPEAKPPRELRGLIIGDSIVMGHGVTAAETFSTRLEDMMHDSVPGFDTYQVINAGIQGYAPFQYREMLRRMMRFAPDFVVITVSMNDIRPQHLPGSERGGRDAGCPAEASITNPWMDFFVNETGFGRLAFKIGGGRRPGKPAVDEARARETYGIRRMVEASRTDSVFGQVWDEVLGDLAVMYAMAERAHIPVVLMISPHRFQLGHAKSQRPQRILQAHALRHSVSCLDLTGILEAATSGGQSVGGMLFDENHYTPKGHLLITRALFDHLTAQGIVPRPRPR